MEKKKGILERLGILYEDDAKDLITENTSVKEKELLKKDAGENVVLTPVSPIDVSGISGDCEHKNVVELAYESMPKTAEDIFVVEELLKNYSSLPQQQSYQILQSTLTTMGKDIAAFIAEAENRKKAISGVLEQYTGEINFECSQIANLIEEAKAKIDQLSQKDIDLRNGLELSKKECETECTRLDMIIKVLGGQIGGK